MNSKYLNDNEIADFFENRVPRQKILITKEQSQYIHSLSKDQKYLIINCLLRISSSNKTKDSIADKVRPRSKLFRALGKEEPPREIEIRGEFYQRLEVYKHDSWAATAIYSNDREKIVCKFNRKQPILGFSTLWLGKRLAQRENKFLQMFEHLPNIPKFCGEVKIEGNVQSNASAHVYVEGSTLRSYSQKVSDDFFVKLQNLLKVIHEKQISYMDLNKRENVIVMKDGSPCLIDFQICFHLPKSWPGNCALMRYLLRLLQKSDEFHLMKHFTRLRPDLFTAKELKLVQKRPWFLNIYRLVQIPLRTLRRQLLAFLGFRGRCGKVKTEAFIEHGIREEASLEKIFHEVANHTLVFQDKNNTLELISLNLII